MVHLLSKAVAMAGAKNTKEHKWIPRFGDAIGEEPTKIRVNTRNHHVAVLGVKCALVSQTGAPHLWQ